MLKGCREGVEEGTSKREGLWKDFVGASKARRVDVAELVTEIQTIVDDSVELADVGYGAEWSNR